MSGDVVERLRETRKLHDLLALNGGEYAGHELRAFADEAGEAAEIIASQVAEIELLKEANNALMGERESLIKTKREQLDRLNEECRLSMGTIAAERIARETATRLLAEATGALERIVRGSVDVSGTAIIVGYPASQVLTNARTTLSNIRVHNG